MLDTLFQKFTLAGSVDRRTISPEPSILTILPTEIILDIVQILPLASAASFAFCSVTAYRILGTRYWEALWTKGQEREKEAFLLLLEREMPNYVLCYQCNILHSGNEVYSATPYWSSGRRPHRYFAASCHTNDCSAGLSLLIHPYFHFSNFQMAMKRYRLGLNYKYHLSLLNYNYTYQERGRFPHHDTFEAQIVAGSLYLRIQRVGLIPTSRSVPTSRYFTGYNYNICRHVHTGDVLWNPDAEPCTLAHRHDLKQCVKLSGLKECISCPTEYNMVIHERGNDDAVVIITKWFDLGEGRTPRDFKWWIRLNESYRRQRLFEGHDCVKDMRQWMRNSPLFCPDPRPLPSRGMLEPHFERVSIRDSFENEQLQAFDPLLIPKVVESWHRL